MIIRAVALAVAGLAIYLLLPSLTRVLASTHPRDALVLLAYAAANVIELVPVTPGGLGLVEASLAGLLVLAGVHGGDALLATLAYRLASYWLPLCAGPPTYLLYRHRYGPRHTSPGTDHAAQR